MFGILYVVATPIGNLADISHRAASILSQVDVIAAEDTRHSLTLLNHLAINKAMVSFHEHNEEQRARELVSRLKSGESVALISDAGTPLISDPGYRLIDLAHQESVQVVPIPGPSAVISALSVAGLATDRFNFEGFLPVKQQARQKFLKTMINLRSTVIFFESNHRIKATLADFQQCFQQSRLVTIAREVTKRFEEIVRLPVSELLNWINANPKRTKGEFVLLLAGCGATEEEAANSTGELDKMLLLIDLLSAELSLKKVVEICVAYFDAPKNKIYKLVLEAKKDTS